VDGFDRDTLGIILNIPLALVNAIGSAVAIFIIEGTGRRQLMLKTLPFIFASCLIVSLSMYLSTEEYALDESGVTRP